MSGTISATTAALIAAAVGAAGVGTSVYEGVQSSDQASAAQKAQQQALAQQQQAQANQANLTKQEAVLGAQGQTQQQTGGSLTDSGTSALTDLLAGYPGYQGGSGTSTGTGVGTSDVGGTGSPGGSGPTPDIASILAALRNNSGSGGPGLSAPGTSGNIFGGNWQTQPATPQNQLELANPLV
jgi:hypothetical protein